MLTCVGWSKQVSDGSLGQKQQDDEEDAVATPRTRQAIKILTSQIKEMVLKSSGAYRSCKACSGCSVSDGRNHADSYTFSASGRFDYGYKRAAAAAGSVNSTPWIWKKEMEARLKGVSSEEGTPVSTSGRSDSIMLLEDDKPKKWVAQVEPGVLITFVSIPQCGNELKRIHFSCELFDKCQAQSWWMENHDKVIDLYNVQTSVLLPTPSRPPQKASNYALDGPISAPKLSNMTAAKTEASSIDASARTSSSGEADQSGELSVSNASEMETKWVEQDEPGVYITIRALADGTRELWRVRFSGDSFTVERGLEKCKLECGGKKTKPEFKSNIYDLQELQTLPHYSLAGSKIT